MIGSHRQAVGHFRYGHRRLPGKQLRQDAVMLRVKMLHQDKGHSRVRGEVIHQVRKSFNAARRSANGYNRGVGHLRGQRGLHLCGSLSLALTLRFLLHFPGVLVEQARLPGIPRSCHKCNHTHEKGAGLTPFSSVLRDTALA